VRKKKKKNTHNKNPNQKKTPKTPPTPQTKKKNQTKPPPPQKPPKTGTRVKPEASNPRFINKEPIGEKDPRITRWSRCRSIPQKLARRGGFHYSDGSTGRWLAGRQKKRASDTSGPRKRERLEKGESTVKRTQDLYAVSKRQRGRNQHGVYGKVASFFSLLKALVPIVLYGAEGPNDELLSGGQTKHHFFFALTDRVMGRLNSPARWAKIVRLTVNPFGGFQWPVYHRSLGKGEGINTNNPKLGLKVISSRIPRV